jgi:hypothetical protein
MATGKCASAGGRHLLIVLMLLLTVISQFAISPKMHAIRAEVGVIDNVPLDNPLRREFDRLHVWSEKFERPCFCWAWWRCTQPQPSGKQPYPERQGRPRTKATAPTLHVSSHANAWPPMTRVARNDLFFCLH